MGDLMRFHAYLRTTAHAALASLLAMSLAAYASDEPARLPWRARRGGANARRTRRQNPARHDAGAERARLAARSHQRRWTAHRRVRSRRRDRLRTARDQDHQSLPHRRWSDRSLPGHYADPDGNRPADARCDHAAHPRSHRQCRRRQEERLGARRVLNRERVQRHRRSLFADVGNRRKPVGLRSTLHRQNPRGVAQGRLAQHYLQQQHHCGGTRSIRRIRKASIRRAR